jgi:pimeloyl-ACP methyl ester carboxylesterase
LRALNPDQTIAVAQSLKTIKVPTLLIWGKEDRFQPWKTVGLRLKTLLPDAVDVVIENAGHFLPIEKPEAYVEAMLSWKRAINVSGTN